MPLTRSTSESSPIGRRPPVFSLKTLFVLLALVSIGLLIDRDIVRRANQKGNMVPPTVLDVILFRRHVYSNGALTKVTLFGEERVYSQAFESRRRSSSRRIIRWLR